MAFDMQTSPTLSLHKELLPMYYDLGFWVDA